MVWNITLIEPAHYIKVTTLGDFAIEDCIKMKEDFLSREYWEPGMNILLDYREAVFFNMSLDSIRLIGDFHESKNDQIGGGRMALLMRSPRDFGFARQYEMVTEGRVLSQIFVFLDEDKALEWITAGAMSA